MNVRNGAPCGFRDFDESGQNLAATIAVRAQNAILSFYFTDSCDRLGQLRCRHRIPIQHELEERPTVRMESLQPGDEGLFVRVSDSDPEMLRYLAAQGVRPGVRITLSEQLPFQGAYHVRIGRSAARPLLSESLANAIFVTLE